MTEQETIPVKPKMILEVDALVRYPEDATVDGVEDLFGLLMPFLVENTWKPRIDLETGKVLDWPTGKQAYVHYKVCDAGLYWITDGVHRWKWHDDYVPSKFLCFGDHGFGDYIIMQIENNGFIRDWKKPEIIEDQWIVNKGVES